MKKGLILLFLLIYSALQANAYELVLPREKKTYVNTNYAFFVGKARNGESISINGSSIYTASNGAFAHSVKLKNGENRIIVKSNFNTQIYRFYKNTPDVQQEAKVCEFDVKPAIVNRDNVPLRSTPIDFGLNRISHLFKGTTVLINAEKADFYRVYLSKDKQAWIAKKDVDVDCSKDSTLADFINMSGENFKNAAVQRISFSKNLPYTVDERDKEIIFKVYNPELSDSSVYTINMPKPEKYTYRVALADGTYTFKVNALPVELADCTVAIDAGHGGTEKGAIGCLGDEEKDVNLRIALELQKQLEAVGVNVVMTRECDGNISLNDRVRLARENHANIFVSIHLNSIGDIPMNVHKNRGTSVYYFNPNSKDLAQILEKTVPKFAGTHKDGVRTASFAVIRPTEYVGVLVETAYMTNPMDSVLYNSENFAQNVAKGIKEGLVEYILGTKNTPN